jgi:spermidine synthase
VTWKRVLRWVALAIVPSSLMLGATTYITTDIAAIPLLWVAPLALYLLSFIIVFSRVPPIVHKILVLLMPLFVLLQLFSMLSEIRIPKLGIGGSLAFHLTTLFVVSMVCHGELARDRPAAKYLTGYFLWMSVGGVLGGLFNALVAPLIFKGIVEYELALLLACFLAPPLGETKESSWGRRADILLGCIFAGLGILLIVLRLRDDNLHLDEMTSGSWHWELAALLAGLAIGVGAVMRARDKKLDNWLDLLLPLSLGLLLLGLVWGLGSKALAPRIARLAGEKVNPGFLRRLITYGVPLVMCYTFIERPLRFTLGVGALLLVAGFTSRLDEGVLHQERSFFGVLKVEKDYEWYGEDKEDSRKLMHGTTLHGIQFLSPDLNTEPLTYYHRSGPIGRVMAAYNDGKRNLAVIGLGTGTMACYAQPGQHLTFYDIDPVVRRLSFDEEKPYFTYVEEARKRGADLELVMGDARLTMERKQLEDSEKYGIIVVDAFSSDAIPIHLITREALQVYLDKLTEDGLLCFHISNRYLDLRPVLANHVKERGLAAVNQSDSWATDPERDAFAFPAKSSSSWVVIARKSKYLDALRKQNQWADERKEALLQLAPLTVWPDNGNGLALQASFLHGLLSSPITEYPTLWEELEPDSKWPSLEKVGTWTDDYSNLLSVFSW